MIELGKAVGAVAEVVELEVKTTLGREPGDRRRLGGHRQARAESRQLGVDPGHDRRGAVGAAGALLQRLQAEEKQPLIGAVAVEAGPADHRRGGDVLFLLQHRRDLPAHPLGLGQGGSVLQLENAHAVALVFFGDEGGGQGRKGDGREHDAAPKPHQDQPAARDQRLEQLGIGGLQAGKESVEAIKDGGQAAARKAKRQHPHHVSPDAKGGGTEATERQPHHHAGHGPAPALGPRWLLRLENQPGHHRREGEGVEGGDGDREGDRERELAVDDADATGVEGHRHEHRHQHQGGGNQGTDQFPHAGQGRLAGFHARLEVFGHRFDHHDGVVHHQPGGQHQPKQGELVDRKAKRLDEGKGAHQGDGNRQAGHHRGPPVLQEEKQDHQHQHNRQAQGIGDPIHRRFNELADVVDLAHRHPWRQLGAEVVDQRHHRLAHLQGVALGGLIHANGDGGVAMDVAPLGGEAVEAIGGLAHVRQPQQIPLR